MKKHVVSDATPKASKASFCEAGGNDSRSTWDGILRTARVIHAAPRLQNSQISIPNTKSTRPQGTGGRLVAGSSAWPARQRWMAVPQSKTQAKTIAVTTAKAINGIAGYSRKVPIAA